jgi:Flp pilus assembly protein TadG
MRRLKNEPGKERGAAGVMVALLMLVLIGAGAMAVDVGQIYAERAQLQNAADAGAMAAAQRCHAAGGCTAAQAKAWAAALSGPNSNDGATSVDSVDLSVPNQVTVVTSTLNGTSGFLTKMFASALNAPPVKVGAHATAAIDTPPGATAFPLAFSDCTFDLSGAASSGAVQLIKYKPGVGTCTSTSGHVIPGGFGWLDQTAPCEADTSAGGIAGSDTGADYPNTPPGGAACDAILTGWRNTIMAGGSVEGTFPVYDNYGGTGTNAWMHIRGYATFKMIGWRFAGSGTPQVFRSGMPYVISASNVCDNPCRGVIGQFVKFESIDSVGDSPGAGPDLGSVIIRLIK